MLQEDKNEMEDKKYTKICISVQKTLNYFIYYYVLKLSVNTTVYSASVLGISHLYTKILQRIQPSVRAATCAGTVLLPQNTSIKSVSSITMEGINSD